MRSDSTMRTRDAMTFLLVVTLLTNLARHELGTVSASGEVEKRNLDSKRRQLERLIRLGLTSTSSNASVPETPPHLQHPSEDSFRAQRYPPGKVSLKWFPFNNSPPKDEWPSLPRNASLKTDWSLLLNGANSVYPDAPPDTDPNGSDLEVQLTKQLELLSEAGNSQFRRHAKSPSSDAATKREEKRRQRDQKREEREKIREEKKKKRNKEKRRFRKENKRMLELIENEGALLHNIDGEDYFDCCPSKLVVVEKQVGKDRNNHAVEVRHSQQYFYERICLPGIEGTECVFPSKSLRKGVLTRCAQQFSYVQAQVRPYRSEQEWQLDYIHVRSGCSCQVSATPRPKKKKGKR